MLRDPSAILLLAFFATIGSLFGYFVYRVVTAMLAKIVSDWRESRRDEEWRRISRDVAERYKARRRTAV